MTRTLQHIAIAATLLLPLIGQQAIAQGLNDGQNLMGLQLAQLRLDDSLSYRSTTRPETSVARNRICTTTCAVGSDEQGEVHNYCVSSCNDGSSETLIKKFGN